MTDTQPSPAPCNCLQDIRDILTDLLNKQTDTDAAVKNLSANVDICINYIQGESLVAAAAIRARTGIAPGACPDDEDTLPGRQ